MSLELRQHIEKITSLTDAEFNYIYSHFTPRKLKKHQFLIQQGENVTNDYFVTKGLLKAYYVNHQDKEHILQFAFEDWWVSDYQAYFSQTKATLHVDCIEDVEVLSLSLQNRDKICSEMHKMEHFF